ncbi:MAG: amidinotransferase [Bacteroidia bacterium]|nr:amidinotransferase [Bacteroidia bacterium]NNC86576.1 amidinotransferase [Bacteroidia bacterium]NNM15368.1 amidinotransferase [Bacteroidia bacterium]
MKTNKQVANAILMVRPNNFQYNEENAETNEFQNAPANQVLRSRLHDIAMVEFDIAIENIEQCKIQVVVENENPESKSPDAIFPNNFVVFHHDGNVYIQKMYSSNRRNELSQSQINEIAGSCNYKLESITDLSDLAKENQFLEGTGSIIFNHSKNQAYAALSPRTDSELLKSFCNKIGYTPILFDTKLKSGNQLYHTNVMLSIGEKFAVICDEVIASTKERKQVLDSLTNSGLKIIKIKYDQMLSFCANILEVKNIEGNSYIIMSANAYQGYTPEQKILLSKEGELLPIPINTIEKISGGSMRCMMAEIFR